MNSEAFLSRLQAKAFAYFQGEVNPLNGLIADKSADNWPASIAAIGLGLTALPIAIERGLITHADALSRTLTTLRFFRDSEQSAAADASGYRGFYYHFLDMRSGRRAWQCELSTVDSAFLFAGMLTAAAYFNGDSADEREVVELADMLYRRADWAWMQATDGTICHGWHPERGCIPHSWQGYDEGLLLYVLAMGSPTHPLPTDAYTAWTSTYEWKHCYDLDYLYCGPLFTHQLSHVWIDFRGIADAFLRDRKIDYFENSRRASLIQQRYAISNPLGFKNYSAHCWGITASDGPGPGSCKIEGIQREFFGYEGRGAPYGIDDGTVSPWAVVASLPFAPEIVMPTLEHFVHSLHLHDQHRYGFKASFNQTWVDADGKSGWISPYAFGINVGPIIAMVENFRSGMLWSLLRNCSPIIAGLRRAGFTGGWLDAAPAARN